MEEQSYAKHTKWVPLFHFVMPPIILVAIGGSIRGLISAMDRGNGRAEALALLAVSLAVPIILFFSRTFALKAQDRAIRAEENLRHFAMTGKLLDARITMAQVIALRFASDAEFVALAQRAAAESLTPDAIKRAIKTWRVDSHRL
jgi:hypothetical protein